MTMTEVIQCEACNATVERGKIAGYCAECGRQVCSNCVRMCESCLLNFCFSDVKAGEIWLDRKPKIYRLCAKCKRQWTGPDWT